MIPARTSLLVPRLPDGRRSLVRRADGCAGYSGTRQSVRSLAAANGAVTLASSHATVDTMAKAPY